MGYCGGNSSYCLTGCQSTFGLCGSSAMSGNTSNNSTPTPTPTPSSVSLSTGAKAGIAVGSIIFALAVIGAIAWYVIRRRKTKPAEEMDADWSQSKSPMIATVSGTVAHEMDGSKNEVSELASGQRIMELDASNRGERNALVDDRAAAGYDGAYRGH
jgi:flagellar biosynthesis/type III secretory pathway M-ring protein FliF/YscJ